MAPSRLVLVLLSLLAFSLGNCEPYNYYNTKDAYYAAGSPPPPSGPPPGYDYFILALQWPNAYCKETGVTCNPKKPEQRFTIHGLWPQRNDGIRAEFCTSATTELNDQILKNKEKDLLKHWPDLKKPRTFKDSKSLWYYQWRKHGTCSSNKLKPEEYLTRAIDLAETYAPRVLEEMKNAGIKFDGTTPYTRFRVLSTIEKATVTTSSSVTKGVEAKLYIKNDNLLEIYLCVNAEGKMLQDCNGLNPYIKFASAPTLTQLPNNLESTSMLEVEEADEFWL